MSDLVEEDELVDIRDLPEYRRKHGLRIVRGEWPLVPDNYAHGKRRPAERCPRLIVEDIEPESEQRRD